MKARANETEQLRNILAIGVWENEGGASGRESLDDNMAAASKRIGLGLSTMSSAAFPRVQPFGP